MTNHLVSLLRKNEVLALRDEIVARLEVADGALHEFARRRNIDVEQLQPAFVTSVTNACLSGMGFAPEEVRGLQPVTARIRGRAAEL